MSTTGNEASKGEHHGQYGKALLAAATAGLVVVGGVHWWNGREDDAPHERAAPPSLSRRLSRSPT